MRMSRVARPVVRVSPKEKSKIGPMERLEFAKRECNAQLVKMGKVVGATMNGKSNAPYDEKPRMGCMVCTRTVATMKKEDGSFEYGVSIPVPERDPNSVMETVVKKYDNLDENTLLDMVTTAHGPGESNANYKLRLHQLATMIWPTDPISEPTTADDFKLIDGEILSSVFTITVDNPGSAATERKSHFSSGEVYHLIIDFGRKTSIRVALDRARHMACIQAVVIQHEEGEPPKFKYTRESFTEALFMFNALSTLSIGLIPSPCVHGNEFHWKHYEDKLETNHLRLIPHANTSFNTIRKELLSMRYIDLELDSSAHFSPDSAATHAHRAVYDMAKLDSVIICLSAVARAMCQVIETDRKENALEVYLDQRNIVKKAKEYANRWIVSTNESRDENHELLQKIAAVLSSYVGFLFCKIFSIEIKDERTGTEKFKAIANTTLNIMNTIPPDTLPTMESTTKTMLHSQLKFLAPSNTEVLSPMDFGSLLTMYLLKHIDVTVSSDKHVIWPRSAYVHGTPRITGDTVVAELLKVETDLPGKSDTGVKWEMAVLYRIMNPVFVSLLDIAGLNHNSTESEMWWKLGKKYSYFQEFPKVCPTRKKSRPFHDHSLSVKMDITRKFNLKIIAPLPNAKGTKIDRTANRLPGTRDLIQLSRD
jgi:hypothetical protein